MVLQEQDDGVDSDPGRYDVKVLADSVVDPATDDLLNVPLFRARSPPCFGYADRGPCLQNPPGGL